jgi:hypothetical protein
LQAYESHGKEISYIARVQNHEKSPSFSIIPDDVSISCQPVTLIMSSEKKVADSGSETHDIAQGHIFSHSDEDIAAAYADKLDGENAYTVQEEKRLRWKLDLRLVPILWLNITLSAMDKVTTSTAALYGMRTATGLTGNRYSWVGSAFYVSVALE